MGNPAEETFCHPNQNFKKPSAPCVTAHRAASCALARSSCPLLLTFESYANFRKCAREIFIFARKIFGAETGSNRPLLGYACWRPKQRVYRPLINTLLQRGVIGRPDVLNRFSGFHHPKPLKRLRFNGLACTQLKQGVNERAVNTAVRRRCLLVQKPR